MFTFPKAIELRCDLRYSPLVQDIGDVITKAHRCVAFPNLYQHQVQPFHLEDKTKPGHRKILVFFLVDPTQRVPSATDVAPQQHEWVTEAMREAGPNSVFARLPVELLAMISKENDGAMTRSEAEKYRKALMAERTVFVEANNESYFGMVRTTLRLVSSFASLNLSCRSDRSSICGGFILHFCFINPPHNRGPANIEVVLEMNNVNLSVADAGYMEVTIDVNTEERRQVFERKRRQRTFDHFTCYVTPGSYACLRHPRPSYE